MKNVKVGQTVLVGQAKEEGTVLAVASKVKVQMKDGKVKYVYAKVLSEKEVIQEPVVSSALAYKYTEVVMTHLKTADASVTELCKLVPSKNSATGYIRPSQLTGTLNYLEHIKAIEKVGSKYTLVK